MCNLPHPPLILVTGPTRSGKSEWAESLATSLVAPTEVTQTAATLPLKQVVYVATAAVDPTDSDWQARIARHQQRRPATWQTQAVGANLTSCIRQAQPTDCLLIDALGTWLVHFLDQTEPEWLAQRNQLLECLQQRVCAVIIVAEETGWGVVPAYPLGRLFRDRLGDTSRRVGAIANTVYLVTGGYALNLSHLGTALPPVWQT